VTDEVKPRAPDPKSPFPAAAKIQRGPTLIASRMTPAQHAGMVVFHTADAAVAERGAMACASCHPDGRADGLSWRIEKHELQTPVLAGRIVNTHPYKWDGGDKDLTTSLTMTMKRLGGIGLGPERTAQLAAYVSMLPTVRAPTRDTATVARGKKLFDSAELGCRSCHDGPALTDQSRHKLAGDLARSDTPSLLGLAASAPYFHDGSAATLEALLRDRGAVHGMAETAQMSDKDLADLVAFLETL
jgi:cytochrome c peroxidase